MTRAKVLELDPWLGNHCRQACDIWWEGKIRDAWPFRNQIRIDAHYFPFHEFAWISEIRDMYSAQ